jgi:hypothetical protein
MIMIFYYLVSNRKILVIWGLKLIFKPLTSKAIMLAFQNLASRLNIIAKDSEKNFAFIINRSY